MSRENYLQPLKKYAALLLALICLLNAASAITVEFVGPDPTQPPVEQSAPAETQAMPAAEDAPLADAAEASEELTYDGLPWYLVLVNADHAVPEDWKIESFTELRNGQRVDRRIYPQLQAMFDAARREGIKPLVLTSYRTYDDQVNIIKSKYSQYRNAGMSKEEAEQATRQIAAEPNHSEHQLGLAVDIDSSDTSVCSNEAVWSWMQHHCQEYGFIWRYPGVKSEITGITNEDWHFRYVGVEAATYIMENQLCLEEYLEQKYGYK